MQYAGVAMLVWLSCIGNLLRQEQCSVLAMLALPFSEPASRLDMLYAECLTFGEAHIYSSSVCWQLWNCECRVCSKVCHPVVSTRDIDYTNSVFDFAEKG